MLLLLPSSAKFSDFLEILQRLDVKWKKSEENLWSGGNLLLGVLAGKPTHNPSNLEVNISIGFIFI